MDLTGTCKYCGQMKTVPFSENITQEEADRIVSDECGCELASNERNIRYDIAKARNAIDKIVRPRYGKTADVLDTMAGSMARGEIAAVKISEGDGARITMVETQKGIAVKIVDTITTTIEDVDV